MSGLSNRGVSDCYIVVWSVIIIIRLSFQTLIAIVLLVLDCIWQILYSG